MNFKGFSKETFDFLTNVKLNNSKKWFEENRNNYNQYLLNPFKDIVCDLSGHMLSIDSNIEVIPAINKTISRIYRDTRFSKDKSLYRSSMWLTFKRHNKSWAESPAFFFEITPDFYRYGVGFYSATPKTMEFFRKMIDENPKKFDESIEFFQNQSFFELKGDDYKKIFDEKKTTKVNNWYNKKSFYIVHNSSNLEEVFSVSLIKDLVNGFNTLSSIYLFLLDVTKRKMEDA
jgi:uncharacterized protein (TIGR02453 family)